MRPILLLAPIMFLLVILPGRPTVAGPLDRQSLEERRNPATDSMLRVPGVLGLLYEDAAMILQQAGLNPRLERIEVEKADYRGREGQVVRQVPAAGGVAMLGSSVTITVYWPPGTDEPGHHGQSQNDSWASQPWGGTPAAGTGQPLDYPLPSPEPGFAEGGEPTQGGWGWQPEPPVPQAATEPQPPASQGSQQVSSPPQDEQVATEEPPAAGTDHPVPSSGRGRPRWSPGETAPSRPLAEPPELAGAGAATFPGAESPISAVVQPLPVTAQLAEPAKRARFRVVATGFRVNHETWDHALNVDGCGDEISVHATAMEVDNGGRVLRRWDRRTPVMGDVNHFPQRVRAGRGECFSFDPPKGGLQTGDQFPGDEPWRLQGAPRTDRLPLVLWEGDLVKGENAVLVIPTIWEDDDRGDLLSQHLDILKGMAMTVAASPAGDLVGWLGKQVVYTAESFGFSFDPIRAGVEQMKTWINNTAGVAAHRPVGMTKRGDYYVELPPPVLAFTYENAEAKLRSGQGQFAQRYQDHQDLKGDYTLYLLIERLD